MGLRNLDDVEEEFEWLTCPLDLGDEGNEGKMIRGGPCVGLEVDVAVVLLVLGEFQVFAMEYICLLPRSR